LKEARLNDAGKIVVKFSKLSDPEWNKVKGWIDSLTVKYFDRNSKEWEVECTGENYQSLRDMNFGISPEIFQLVSNMEIDESWKDLSVPDKYSYLYPDQQEVFKFAMANDWRILEASSMGAGKTNTTLSICDYHEFFPMLIICPTIVRIGWVRQHSKWLGDNGDRIKILESAKDLKYYDDEYDIYITNYQLLARQMGKVKTDKGSIMIAKEPLKEFYDNFFETVVIDECHKVKSLNSQTTQAVKYLCEGSTSIMALTGTPLLNKNSELFPILNILRPDVFDNYDRFCKRYCQEKITYSGKRKYVSYYGTRNNEELHTILKNTVMIRHTQKQIKEARGEEYLKPNIQVLPIKPSGKSKYKEAEKSFRESIQKGEKKNEALGKLSRMRAEAWQLKKKACFEFIDDLIEETENKIVVFIHNKVLIDDLLEKYGEKMVYISGEVDTNPEVRDKIVDKFIEDDGVKLFVGSIEAVNAGLDRLQLTATELVYLQEPWNSGVRDQCDGRISNRTGAIGRASIFHLILEDSIEVLFLRLQDKKASAASMVIDGETMDEGDYMMNIFNYYSKKEKQ
jgi:SWI/SNF-related matrix-associated actin-dependent regulator 1 of chromatin subfamily A